MQVIPGFVSGGTKAALRLIPPLSNAGHDVLFNSMIHPFAVGPMSVSIFIWFQGEANLGYGPTAAMGQLYGCAQPAMIQMWRDYL